MVKLPVPVSGQDLVKTTRGVVCEAGQNVGKPGLGIDAVEAGRLEQRVHQRRALAAAIGTGKQPSLASQGDAAQRPLGGVVGQSDPAIIEEASNGAPTLEPVVHRLGDLGMA